VQQAKEEGFPTDVEEKESYFLAEIHNGEVLVAEGEFCI
jgi:import receptor subunit TOM20